MTSISQRAVNFDNWTNSAENYQTTFVEGKKVEEYKMFDFEASTYSTDLKEFAQDYINLYDKDDDGKWDRNEFISMALNQEDISSLKENHHLVKSLINIYDEMIAPNDADKDGVLSKEELLNYLDVDKNKLSADELQEWDEVFEAYNALDLDNDKEHINAAELAIVSNFKDMPKLNEMYADYVTYEDAGKLFDRLNLDNDNTRISAEEYASELYLSDLDMDTYGATGNIAAALDGKLNYGTFQTLPFLDGSSKEFIDGEKIDFYNNFYAK